MEEPRRRTKTEKAGDRRNQVVRNIRNFKKEQEAGAIKSRESIFHSKKIKFQKRKRIGKKEKEKME